MKQHERCLLRREEEKFSLRLGAARSGSPPSSRGPVLGASSIQVEMSRRVRAIPCGGIGAVHLLAQKVGLVEALDTRLHILKRRRPYSESDHILNIAYNFLCGGSVLDDIEVRRNDPVFLDALGATMIPDPTTAADFCRRFHADQLQRFMDIVNNVRASVWKKQPSAFFKQAARIDADSSIVETKAECKQGMNIAYNGAWGYQALIISLANTGEPLFIINRSGNRPSAEGSPEYFDRAITLCREAGFQDILLRGDTAFSLTKNFDRWDNDSVRFVFGYGASKTMVEHADAIGDDEFQLLVRKAENEFSKRAKQPRIKEQIIREREFNNIRLEREDIAEFEYQPGNTDRPYRFIVLAKTITEEKGQRTLGYKNRYFFYVTNDRKLSAEEVIREANGRCNQENLISQLKNGPRALHAPLHTLDSNWAYMLIASLAWSLKAWFALLTPISPRWRKKHEADRERVQRMDFRSFVQHLIMIPAQILFTGRRLVYRILAWRPDLPILFRLLDGL